MPAILWQSGRLAASQLHLVSMAALQGSADDKDHPWIVADRNSPENSPSGVCQVEVRKGETVK